jgi:hypothetical protein
MVTSAVVLLLTYINGPFFFVGISTLHRLFYYVISVLPFLWAIYKGVRCNFQIKLFFIDFLFYLVCSLLVVLVTKSFDIQFLIALIRAILGITGTISVFFIYNFFLKRGKIKISFSMLVIQSTGLYIMGTIMFICFPYIKTIWASVIIDFKKADYSNFVEYITRYGFAGFSGFGFAFLVSSSAIVLSYLYINRMISELKTKLYSIVILLGSFFYGRIGFVLTLIVFLLLALYSFYHHRRKLLIFFLILISIFVVLGFLIYYMIPDIKPFMNWLVEPLLNWVEGGKAESASTNSLIDFYKNFHPSDVTILFGDGFWFGSDGEYYGNTDVGFMRNIYYGGLFYTFIQYTLVFVLILQISLYMFKANKRGWLFIPFLLVIEFISFELKGDIVFIFLKQYLPIYISFIYERGSEQCVSTIPNIFRKRRMII